MEKSIGEDIGTPLPAPDDATNSDMDVVNQSDSSRKLKKTHRCGCSTCKSMRQHMRMVKKLSNEDVHTSAPESGDAIILDSGVDNNMVKKYRCGFCDQRFKRKGDLKQHELVHSGVKPFQCGKCDAKFAHSGTRNRHELVHSKEKTHPCGKCGKTFARADNKNRHERVCRKVPAVAATGSGVNPPADTEHNSIDGGNTWNLLYKVNFDDQNISIECYSSYH